MRGLVKKILHTQHSNIKKVYKNNNIFVKTYIKMQNERTKDCDCDKIYMIIKIRIIKT